MSSITIPEPADTVLISSLHLISTIGTDHWNRPKAQPITISTYLNLRPSYLTTAGRSDEVTDSVHYGHLAKRVSALVEGMEKLRNGGTSSKGDNTAVKGWKSAEEVAKEVAKEAFDLGGEVVHEVKIVIEQPKAMLLAIGGLETEVVLTRDLNGDVKVEGVKKVTVKDLTLPVLIGVNPPERKARQLVRTDIVLYELPSTSAATPDYSSIVEGVYKLIDASDYLTLEKFVYEILRVCLTANENIGAATVISKKPSALSFADASGVQMTRRREDFA